MKTEPTIAISIPTIRPERYKEFLEAWTPLFEKHNVELFTVWDGKDPVVQINNGKGRLSVKDIMGKYSGAIVNLNGGIRNLGFAAAHRFSKPDIYITLDDDETPVGDTIQDHIDALNMKVPVSWLSTYSEYMRGFPYLIRDEAQVVLSHGTWNGFMDWDAPTQLVLGNREAFPYIGPIPKGIYYPMCFTPESLITAEDGTLKPISDINIGDKVMSNNGIFNIVTNKLTKNINEKIISINMSGMKQPIQSTKNHELLTLSGWKKAKDITKEDYLCVPRQTNIKTKFSNNSMYLLGVFLAEGSVCKQKGMKNKYSASGVNFSFHAKEKNTLARRVDDAMKEKFGKEGKFYLKDNQLRVEYYGKDLALWFIKYAGQYSFAKRINKKLIQSNNVNLLLKGLFEGDGWVGENRNRPNTVLTTVSPYLAQQVKMIIDGMGIYCSLTSYLAKNRIYPQYRINLYGKSALTFNKEVMNNPKEFNSIKNESQKSYKLGTGYLYVKVNKTEEIKYNGQVFDLEVEKNHTYLVNGCVVHNCIMNVAFKACVLPWMYQAPRALGVVRAGDMISGVVSKRAIDENGWAVINGMAEVNHNRASNVYKNLQQEALEIELYETFYKGDESHPYFKIYRDKLKIWQNFIEKYE